MSYVVLLSTASSQDEAGKIAHKFVENGLVACVNIIPNIRSIYLWKDKVCDESEVMLVMKAHSRCVEKIKTELKSIHSYECPELVVLPVSDGLADYLKWVDETSINF